MQGQWAALKVGLLSIETVLMDGKRPVSLLLS